MPVPHSNQEIQEDGYLETETTGKLDLLIQWEILDLQKSFYRGDCGEVQRQPCSFALRAPPSSLSLD